MRSRYLVLAVVLVLFCFSSVFAQTVNPRTIKGAVEVNKAVLKPSVELSFPSEGETWETGMPYTISWNSVGIPAANCEVSVKFGCVEECSGFSCISYGISCIQFMKSAAVTGKPQGSLKLTMPDSSKLDSKYKQGDVIDHTGVVVTVRNTVTNEELSIVRNVKLKVGPSKPISISATGTPPVKTVSTAVTKAALDQPKVSLQEVQGSINFTDPAEDAVLWEVGKTYTVSWESMFVPNNATGTISFACGMGDPEQNQTFSAVECFSFAQTIQESAPVSGSAQFTVPFYPHSSWGGQMQPPHGKPVVMFLTANFMADNKYYHAQRKVKVKALP